ncbi:hypothetical protein ACFQ9X_08750 [Catenulispora yoronensis]
MRTDEYPLSAAEVDDLRVVLDELGGGGLSPTDPDFYQKYRGCHELLPAGCAASCPASATPRTPPRAW